MLEMVAVVIQSDVNCFNVTYREISPPPQAGCVRSPALVTWTSTRGCKGQPGEIVTGVF